MAPKSIGQIVFTYSRRLCLASFRTKALVKGAGGLSDGSNGTNHLKVGRCLAVIRTTLLGNGQGLVCY